MLEQNLNKINYFLFLILPLTIIAGSSVSLINIFFIIFLYLYNFFNYKHYWKIFILRQYSQVADYIKFLSCHKFNNFIKS